MDDQRRDGEDRAGDDGPWAVLRAILELMDEPLLVLDMDGRLRHGNAAGRTIVDREPLRRIVLRSLEPEAARLGRDPDAPPSAYPTWVRPPGTSVIETPAGRFRVWACPLGRDILPGVGLVAFRLDRRLLPRRVPEILDERFEAARRLLQDEYGLTEQEARVALLLTERRTNDEIAERLVISPHTARHHTEAVLAKLGVHSRSEVEPTLIGRWASSVAEEDEGGK